MPAEDMASELAQARATTFEPYTLHRTPAMSGRYINVAQAGFRHGASSAVWPPAAGPTIFVFGGSTAFGYGLTDSETIPAALEDGLRAAGRPATVYNFASLNHTSVEERIRFEQLLVAGQVPDVALFIDGFAELVAPYYADAMHRRIAGAMSSKGGRASIVAGIDRLVSRVTGRSTCAAEIGVSPQPAATTIDRYLAGLTLIEASAEAFGVRPLFVWQPVPCYAYPGEATSRHAAGHADAGLVLDNIRTGYGLMRDALAARGRDTVLWLAEMQSERTDELYLDPDHYDAAFSREIASRLVPHVAALLAR
jgi:hypothetical protein